jgi:hypothetical protein
MTLPDHLDFYAIVLTFAFLGATWVGLFIFRLIGAPARLYWVERQKTEIDSDFLVSDSILTHSKWVTGGDGEHSGLYETAFYLGVNNNRPDGKTLRRVRMRLFVFGEPELCSVKETGGTEIDLRHGETAFFKLGRVISKRAGGFLDGSTSLSEEDLAVYECNISAKHIRFDTEKHSLNSAKPDYLWRLTASISADDSISKHVSLSLLIHHVKSKISIGWAS